MSFVVWTPEARARLDRAPAFVRPGIEKLMAKRCGERGRAVVDSEFLTEIRNESMLLVAKCLRGFGFDALSADAFDVARAKMRKLPRKLEVIDEIERFLRARTERNSMVLTKFARYLEMIPERGGLLWTEEARARLERVPEHLRPLVAQMVESTARQERARLVSGGVVERCLERSTGGGEPVETAPRAEGAITGVTMLWTAEAEERLRRMPLESVRCLVVRATEAHARARGLDVIDAAIFEEARAARLSPGTESTTG